MFKISSNWCGARLGARAGAWAGCCPWFLDPGEKTPLEGLGVGVLRMAAIYQSVQKYFGVFLTSTAARLSQSTAEACQPGRRTNSRPLSTFHIDLGLGGARCSIGLKVIVV